MLRDRKMNYTEIISIDYCQGSCNITKFFKNIYNSNLGINTMSLTGRVKGCKLLPKVEIIKWMDITTNG